MLYATLGNTGLIVSRLSLGTMTFTAGGGTQGIAKTNAANADALIGRAIDAGVNFLDTADIYAGGDSETILGEKLGRRRDELVIATKVGWRSAAPLNRSGLSALHIHRSIDASLARLKTDHVDVYVAHRDDGTTPLEEVLVALDSVVRAGKARYLGFSNWPAWKVAAALEFQRANGLARFSHGQMMYSLLGRSIEEEVVPMMRHYGLGLTAWSPLAGGLLSGKYDEAALKDPDNRLARVDWMPNDKSVAFALVERMRTIATGHGATVAQVALAWLLSRDIVSSVILGASKMSQLEDNLGAAALSLSGDELAELDTMTAEPARYPATVAGMQDQPIAKALAATAGAGFLPDPTQTSAFGN